ncbi:hypothetical protein FQA39_LY05515 [Lamprigera yunnana]|nr:hypothetical protein FQA39_LY05515 [Lamprigera yunnana]
MVQPKMSCNNKLSDIQHFFDNKTVLVTGATGFLGKLLVEKLLRTCNVRILYITIRPKKDKDVDERLKEYLNSDLFERVKSENTELLRKIKAVSADVTQPNIGLTNIDRDILKNAVNVVIHGAATIRFDESLRVATYTNVIGTEELLKLCMEFKNLTSVVYVSTAYSSCVQSEGHEVFYKPPLQSNQLISLVDALDDKVLDEITPSILGKWPNTYAFTKSVAEDCVKRMGNKLPIVVIRPSIVLSTAEDPLRGWADRPVGVSLVMINIMLGVIHTFQCNFEIVADVVPADYVVNCLLAAAMKVSQERKNHNFGYIPVYNCVTSTQNPVVWGDFSKYINLYVNLAPSSLQVWKMFFVRCTNKYHYAVLHFLLHFLPAFILDTIWRCFGKKRQLVKLYQRVDRYLNIVSYFTTNQWTFYNTNTQNLWKDLNETDQTLYPFDVKMINWESFFHSFFVGCRIYLLKDPLETVNQGHSKYFKLQVAHYMLITFLTIILLCILQLFLMI